MNSLAGNKLDRSYSKAVKTCFFILAGDDAYHRHSYLLERKVNINRSCPDHNVRSCCVRLADDDP